MSSVTVHLHGSLQEHVSFTGPHVVDLPAGANLLALQDQLGIPRGEIGLFVVNGVLRDETETPEPGARVDMYPLFGGG